MELAAISAGFTFTFIGFTSLAENDTRAGLIALVLGIIFLVAYGMGKKRRGADKLSVRPLSSIVMSKLRMWMKARGRSGFQNAG